VSTQQSAFSQRPQTHSAAEETPQTFRDWML